MPWVTENGYLTELFKTIAQVEHAEIQYLPDGRSNGTGVVRFQSEEMAEKAIGENKHPSNKTRKTAANRLIDTFTGYLYGQRPLGITFAKRNTRARAEAQEGSGEAMGGMEHQAQDQMMEPTGITQDQIM